MSVLKNRSNLQTIYLESSKKDAQGNDVAQEQQDWVLMDVGPETGADLDIIDSKDSTGVTIKKKVLNRIQQWSFTDEAGNALPVTLEAMNLMDGNDILDLNIKLNGALKKPEGLTPAEKKDSASI